ncbi:YceI family protein [Candidatus Poribacteria bacterium]|nr:YceI family protein [Candidatus Poribacteria bacterium]
MSPLALVLALAVVAAAGAEELRFGMNEDARDELKFTSRAPLEQITGRAAKIRGSIAIPDSTQLLGDSVAAWFEVDLTSIDTGIELRNAHMRDRFLQTSLYPTATLRLREVVGAVVADDADPDGVRSVSALEPGAPTRLSIVGTFRVHGEEREIQIDNLTVTHFPASDDTKGVRPGDLLTVKGSFAISLDDYRIVRPRALFLRLSDRLEVEFHMTAAAGIVAPSPSPFQE